MFDLTAYYTWELERIAASSGASDEVCEQITVELLARQNDPSREPGYVGREEEKPARRYRRRAEHTTC